MRRRLTLCRFRTAHADDRRARALNALEIPFGGSLVLAEWNDRRRRGTAEARQRVAVKAVA